MSTRILFLIPTLDRSGAEKQLALLATHLPRDEFQPEVVALTRGGPYAAALEQAGVPVTVLGKRWKCDPLAWVRLRRLLRSTRPDLLHTWLFAANAYGRLALPRQRQTRCIVSERCVDSWKAGWQLWLDRKLIPRTDCLVGNSLSVAEFYLQQGYPADRVQMIPNAIEPSTRANHTRHTLRASLGIPDDAFVVLSIGRLAPQKRVRDLIWAAETLWQIRPQVHLVVIGDGPERRRLEDFVEEVHGRPHIHFLGHREDATEWLAAGDVFWLGSSFEGMSNSLMEAMEAGLPVVATDIPPNRELIAHDVHGFLARVGDPVGFMQFTRRIIDEPDLRQRLGSAAQEQMRQHYGVTQMVDRYVALYRQVLTAGRSST